MGIAETKGAGEVRNTFLGGFSYLYLLFSIDKRAVFVLY